MRDKARLQARTSISVRAVRFVVALMFVLFCVSLVYGCGSAGDEARDLEAAGDLAGAVEIYANMLENDPEDLQALRGIASDLFLLQRWDEALIYQERLVALDPEDVQTRIELGFNYLNHQNRPGDAVRVMAEAATLDETAKHLTFLAQAQAVSGETDEAETSLRKAIQIEPDYARSYTVLAALLEKEGRTEEAAAVREAAREQGVDLESGS